MRPKLLRALGPDVTLSDLEDGFLELLGRHGLPLPRTNIDHAGDEVDCRWTHLGLTIELLSFAFTARARPSRTPSHAAGARATSPTPGDVFERGDRTAAELAPLLGNA